MGISRPKHRFFEARKTSKNEGHEVNLRRFFLMDFMELEGVTKQSGTRAWLSQETIWIHGGFPICENGATVKDIYC